jgi:1-acyl-sn-glycerol-3-phosphate acyltransferase
MPPPGSLLVANHLSWLDIPLALASFPCTFVAKHEVRRWPLMSALGDALDVIWIERRKPRDLLRVLPILESALRTGRTVLLFPEGTTTSGHSVLPFRSGLLEAAVRANAPVVPVALSGAVRHGDLDALCWYGDESLLANVPRVAALEGARMRLHLGAPLTPSDDRKQLARSAREHLVRRFRRALHRNIASAPPAYVPRARAKQNLRPIESSDREILA